MHMAIRQDGLSQLLSSYASDESEGSGSEEEDSAGTIESVRGKGNPHKADDAGCEIQRLAQIIFFCRMSITIFHILKL